MADKLKGVYKKVVQSATDGPYLLFICISCFSSAVLRSKVLVIRFIQLLLQCAVRKLSGMC
jgi:hypothetical protein